MAWDRNRYVVFDVETTGLYPQRGARIIEIGAVCLKNVHIVAEFSSLIDCGCIIPDRVRAIHGTTNGMLVGQPSAEEVFGWFLDFVSDGVLVAHNAEFDVRFLRYELGRLGRGLPNRYICTLKLSKK